MSILLGWLSPVRAIFIWIDFIAFSLVDNVYNIFLIFAKNEVLSLDAVKKLTSNIYILVGILAFFRLAMLLINSIISPDKLYEKKTGMGSLLGRVVLMIVLLIFAPSFIFPALQDLQNEVVDKNVIPRLIMPSAARSVTAKGSNFKRNSSGKYINFDNAGKTMQKIAITSLIRPEERYFEEGLKGSDGKEISQAEQVNAFINSEFPDDSKSGMKALKQDTSALGFKLNSECKKICQKAMIQYHQVISDTKGMNLGRLAGYIGGSRDLEDPDDPDEKEDVYYYEYIAVLTTVTAIFLTYVILSWAIDIAVRSVELAVLRVISPLFIATIVDPKSTQDGGYFNNFIKRYGKTYADLFIKIAIISFAILGLSLIQDTDLFDTVAGVISLW